MGSEDSVQQITFGSGQAVLGSYTCSYPGFDGTTSVAVEEDSTFPPFRIWLGGGAPQAGCHADGWSYAEYAAGIGPAAYFHKRPRGDE